MDAATADSHHRHPDGTIHHTRLFGLDDVDQVRVIHVPSGTPLHRQSNSPRAYGRLAVELSTEPTLPPADAYIMGKAPIPRGERDGRVVLPPEAWERYNDLTYELRANVDIDQMLGWADNFTHGPDVPPEVGGDFLRLPHAERLALSTDARMLLQLSPKTCEWSGMRFGRTLYIYVRGSALKERDFSGAWYDMD